MNRQEAIKWYETKLHVNETLGLVGRQNEAARLAIAALRAQEEAEKSEPLTPEELLEMDGEPVWLVTSVDEPQWAIVANDGYYHGKIISFFCAGCVEWEFDLYGDNDGETYLAYRHKPKEA